MKGRQKKWSRNYYYNWWRKVSRWVDKK